MAVNNSPQRILIIGPAWLGDMVLSQSLMKALHAENPAHQIAVAAPDWSKDVLSLMPEVTEIHSLPFTHGSLQLRQRWQLGQALRRKGYDRAIVLPNSLKSALLPFFAGIPHRTGYIGEHRYGLLNDWRVLDKVRHPRTVERFVALSTPNLDRQDFLLPELQVPMEWVAERLTQYRLDTATPVLAVCPGAAYGPAKQWFPSRYREVIFSAIDDGYQIWLLGSQQDVEICQTIKSGIDSLAVTNLAGRMPLRDSIILLAHCNRVLTNDSGLMHVAAALKKKAVAIFGSSSPAMTPPLGDSVSVLYSALPCSPCFQRHCPLGHRRCMETITPAMVLKALELPN